MAEPGSFDDFLDGKTDEIEGYSGPFDDFLDGKTDDPAIPAETPWMGEEGIISRAIRTGQAGLAQSAAEVQRDFRLRTEHDPGDYMDDSQRISRANRHSAMMMGYRPPKVELTPEQRAARDQDLADDRELTYLEATSKRLEEVQAERRPPEVVNDPWSLKGIAGASLEAGTRMVPGLAVGALGGGPAATLAAIGADVYGRSMYDGRMMGLTEEQSRTRAGLNVLAEVVPEALPVTAILGKLPAGKLGTWMTATLGEAGQEALTEVLQQGMDRGYFNEDASASDALKWLASWEGVTDIGYAATIGAVMGGVLGVPAALSAESPIQNDYDPDADAAEIGARLDDAGGAGGVDGMIAESDRMLDEAAQDLGMQLDAQQEAMVEQTIGEMQGTVEPPATEYDWASSQLRLMPREADAIIHRAAQNIDPADLNEAEGGMEDEPHITIRYGLDPQEMAQAEAALASMGPIEVEFGPVEIFEPEGKDYDVVVQTVDSPELRELRRRVEVSTQAPGETFPDYRPHMTLAYVNRGTGQKYADMRTGFEGGRVRFTAGEVTDLDGNPIEVPFEQAEFIEPQVTEVPRETASELTPEEGGISEGEIEPVIGTPAEEPPETRKYFDSRLKRKEFRDEITRIRDELPAEDRSLNLDPKRDDIVTAIRKVGGVSQADLVAEGVDPDVLRNLAPGFIRTNGRHMDDLRETLAQDGYPADLAEFVQAVTDTLNGRPVYSSDYQAYGEEADVQPSQIRNAIDKALEGKSLGTRQSRIVQGLLDNFQGERTQPNVLEEARQRLADRRANRRRAVEGQMPVELERELDEFYSTVGDQYEEDVYPPEADVDTRILMDLAQAVNEQGGDAHAILGQAEVITDDQAFDALEEALEASWSVTEQSTEASFEAALEDAYGPEEPETEGGSGAQAAAEDEVQQGAAEEEGETDLAGPVDQAAQAAADEARARDEARNTGSDDMTGTLFGQDRGQTDLMDLEGVDTRTVPQGPPVVVEQPPQPDRDEEGERGQQLRYEAIKAKLRRVKPWKNVTQLHQPGSGNFEWTMDALDRLVEEGEAQVAWDRRGVAKYALVGEEVPEAYGTTNPDVWREQGRAAFEAGEGRRIPIDLVSNELASKEWGAGWDQANLAAPVEKTTEPDLFAESSEEPAQERDEALVTVSNTYASGVTAVTDMRGAIESGQPFGVDVGLLTGPGQEQLVQAVLDGAEVFIDSGAFRIFRENEREAAKSRQVTFEEFGQGGKALDSSAVIARYMDIMRELEESGDLEAMGRVHFVAPDEVGSARNTLRLLDKHSPDLFEIRESGIDLIVPYQRGMTHAQVTEALGEGVSWRIGVPSNAKAMTAEELAELGQESQAAKWHLLGAGTEETAGEKIQVLRDLSDSMGSEVDISLDANTLRSRMDDLAGLRGEERIKAIQRVLEREQPPKQQVRADQFDKEPNRLVLSTGVKLRSKSGRELSPVPKIDASGPRKTVNTLKRVNEWLLEEAKKEVAGNSFQETLLRAIDLGNLSQSDQDTMNDLLFGDPLGPTEANIITEIAPTHDEEGYPIPTDDEVDAIDRFWEPEFNEAQPGAKGGARLRAKGDPLKKQPFVLPRRPVDVLTGTRQNAERIVDYRTEVAMAVREVLDKKQHPKYMLERLMAELGWASMAERWLMPALYESDHEKGMFFPSNWTPELVDQKIAEAQAQNDWDTERPEWVEMPTNEPSEKLNKRVGVSAGHPEWVWQIARQMEAGDHAAYPVYSDRDLAIFYADSSRKVKRWNPDEKYGDDQDITDLTRYYPVKKGQRTMGGPKGDISIVTHGPTMDMVDRKYRAEKPRKKDKQERHGNLKNRFKGPMMSRLRTQLEALRSDPEAFWEDWSAPLYQEDTRHGRILTEKDDAEDAGLAGADARSVSDKVTKEVRQESLEVESVDRPVAHPAALDYQREKIRAEYVKRFAEAGVEQPFSAGIEREIESAQRGFDTGVADWEMELGFEPMQAEGGELNYQTFSMYYKLGWDAVRRGELQKPPSREAEPEFWSGSPEKPEDGIPDQKPEVKGRISTAAKRAKDNYGKRNKVFKDDERRAARKKRLLQRSKDFNTGIDPELMADVFEEVGYHMEAGLRAFGEIVDAMVDEFGDWIVPYLRGAYENIRTYPGIDDAGMSTPEEVAAWYEENWTDVSGDRRSVESDRADVRDELGEEGVRNAPGADRPGPAAASEPVSQQWPVEERPDSSVPVPDAAIDGTPGNLALFEQDGSVRSEGGPARDPNAAGSPGDRGKRVAAAERERPDGARPVAGQTPLERQRAADAAVGRTEWGNLGQIQEYIPALQAKQAEDVAKAERRFFVADTGIESGMMLTNGTGTGKTFSGLGTVKRFVQAGKTEILILAPYDSVLTGWIRSAAEYFGLDVYQLKNTKDAGSGITATLYDNLKQNDALLSRKWDLVVADESHHLMSNKDGSVNDRTKQFFNITLHPDWLHARARAEMNDQFEAIKEEADRKGLKTWADDAALNRRWNELEAAAKERAKVLRTEPRPKVLFLSASPFAYHKTLDYADTYLFDYQEGNRNPDGSVKDHMKGYSYNSGDSRESFFMEHLGYRMRTNKLTQPEAEVDLALMERRLNEWFIERGSMSRRMLELDVDYSREFIEYTNGLGEQIDAGMREIQGWTVDEEGNWQSIPDEQRLVDRQTAEFLRKKWDFHYMNALLEGLNTGEAIKRAQAHLAMGRQVVIFHRYKTREPSHPFRFHESDKRILERVAQAMSTDKETGHDIQLIEEDIRANVDAIRERASHLWNLDMSEMANPVRAFKDAFGDRVGFINGDIPKKQRQQYIDEFNKDDSDLRVIVVQIQAGKEGWSGHDVTGKHQRALISVGLPTQPTDTIQLEGRTYRTGSKTDAIFEYLKTGLSFEERAYAQTIASRSSTAENLAMGNDARDLMTAFVDGYENSVTDGPNANQGKGGKESDRSRAEDNPWQQAIGLYYANQKKDSRTKAREGKDYFATPEPLGLKMVEFLALDPNEKALEPSAGHGALARWFPDHTKNTFVEPSPALVPRLQLHARNGKVLEHTFEKLHIVNKFHGIAMNPPFGVGGSDAIPHLEKAAGHLFEGGRVVAIIPTGPAADKRFDKWFYGDDAGNLHLRMEILLPQVTFTRAGTTAATRVVVIDKISDEEAVVEPARRRELDGITDIKALFEALENMTAPPRIRPDVAEQDPMEVKEQLPEPTKAAADPLPGDLYGAKTQKNTRTDEDMHMAIPQQRVSRELYDRAKGVANQFGGYWSRYRNKAAGIEAGFAFPDEASRDGFLEAMNQTPQFALEVSPIGFYSGLSRAAAALKQEKGTPDQMLKALKKQAGVKDEEIAWTGLEEWMEARGRSVTRDEMVSFLELNGVEVEERVLSEGNRGQATADDVALDFDEYIDFDFLPESVQVFHVESQKEVDDSLTDQEAWMRASADYSETKIMRYSASIDNDLTNFEAWYHGENQDDGWEVRDTRRNGDDQSVMWVGSEEDARMEIVGRLMAEGVIQDELYTPSYSEYTEPGGENYREILLHTPPLPSGFDPTKVAVRRVKRSLTEGEATLYYEDEPIARYGDEYYRDPNTQDYVSKFPDTYLAQIARKMWDNGEIVPKSGGAPNRPKYIAGHYGGQTPNVLAHFRVKDRYGANGEKILFVEEIQSDWHQAGRKYGYAGSNQDELARLNEEYEKAELELEAAGPDFHDAVDEIGLVPRRFGSRTAMGAFFVRNEEWRIDLLQDGFEITDRVQIAAIERWREARLQRDAARTAVEQAQPGKGVVPDAPFKGNAWAELSLKRLIRMAAEGGYEGVAWTTGQMQADRYQMGSAIDELGRVANSPVFSWSSRLDGDEYAEIKGVAQLVTPNGNQLNLLISTDNRVLSIAGMAVATAMNMRGQPLASVIGQELAQKWEEMPEGTTLSGDFDIGGLGHKSFYDRTLPNLMKKVARKLDKGATVGRFEQQMPTRESLEERFEIVHVYDLDGKSYFQLEDNAKDEIVGMDLPIEQAEEMREAFISRVLKDASGQDRYVAMLGSQIPWISEAERVEYQLSMRPWTVVNMAERSIHGAMNTEAQARDVAASMSNAYSTVDGVLDGTHYLPITPEIARIAVEEGQSLFATRSGFQKPLSGPIAGMTADQVKAAVKDAYDAVHTGLGLQVQIIHSNQLPAHVAAKIPANRVAKGLMMGRTVYLMHDQLKDAKEAQATFAHEVVGHVGINALLGTNWAPVQELYDELKKQGGAKFREIHDQVKGRYGDVTGDTELKEFIAVAAEMRAREGRVGEFMRQVREFVRKALRALGLGKMFSTTDIDILLTRSERYLARGGPEEDYQAVPQWSAGQRDRVNMPFKEVTRRIPALTEAAQKLRSGEITREEYAALVEREKPVAPYTEIPVPASRADMERSLAANQKPRIGISNDELKQGDRAGLRLDIPAYQRHGVWVVSVHGPRSSLAKGSAGKSIGYENVAALSNATFGINEKASISIAAGKAKAPMATIEGEWLPVTEAQAIRMAEEALQDPRWAQVGMDPERHAYFYDRETMDPVVGAEQIIQVGPLVLALNPEYAYADEFMFSLFEDAGERRRRLYIKPHFTDPEVEAIDRNFGVFQRFSTRFRERFDEIRYNAKDRFRWYWIDSHDALRTVLGDEQAWMKSHLAKSAWGSIEAAMDYGQIYLEDGVIQLDESKKSLKELLAPLGTDLDRFMFWIVGNRAERLKAEERENLISDQDIQLFKGMNAGKEALFDRVRADFEAFGDSIVQIAVDTGLIDPDEADIWRQEGFYVPFYRVVMEDPMSQGPRSLKGLDDSGLVRQTAFRRLKGGTDKLADPLGNALANWHHLVGAALKNQAAREALETAEQLGLARRVSSKNHQKDDIFVRVDGKPQWWRIDDGLDGQMVMRALVSMNTEGLNGSLMKWMRTFKRTFTTGVTASPEFKMANLIRDTGSALATSDVSWAVWKNLWQGGKAVRKGGKLYNQMLAGGAIFPLSGYIHGADPDAIRYLLNKGISRDTVLDTRWRIKKAWDTYQDFGAALENVNRAAIYIQALDAGKSKLEATFMARDLLDFSRTGGGTMARIFAQTVSFLNARIQGLDKLGRAAADGRIDPNRANKLFKTQRAQFASTVLAYTAMSVAIYLMMRDDDDFKEAEQWERDTYHLVKWPGTDILWRIPRPFEVGAIANMFERMVEQFVDEDVHGELFLERMGATLFNTFSFNPVPQMAWPALEVYSNYNAFAGRPIESRAMENMSSHLKRNHWTSETAIALSEGMGKILWDDVVLSPVQIEHLVNGYFGWMGATVLAVTDEMTRVLTGAPTDPAMKWSEWPVIKRFVRTMPRSQTKYTTEFYENWNDIQKAVNDIREYREARDWDAYDAALAGREGDLRTQQRRYDRAGDIIRNYRKQQQLVRQDPTLSPEEKRRLVDEFQVLINQRTQLMVETTP